MKCHPTGCCCASCLPLLLQMQANCTSIVVRSGAIAWEHGHRAKSSGACLFELAPKNTRPQTSQTAAPLSCISGVVYKHDRSTGNWSYRGSTTRYDGTPENKRIHHESKVQQKNSNTGTKTNGLLPLFAPPNVATRAPDFMGVRRCEFVSTLDVRCQHTTHAGKRRDKNCAITERAQTPMTPTCW